MAGTAGKSDPFMSYRFRVEIGGIIVAQMSEVTGIQAQTDTETYEEGGVNNFVHILPKRTKFSNLVLKRGITDLDQLWQWHQDVVNGRFERRDGSIILMDSEGNDRWRWEFSGAYPVRWTGPDLKADSSTIAFETIELAHQGIWKGKG
ncbi:phage tail protein [Methanosarcina sp. DH2]|nr:phage tail protein [Methanosarcina sp.]MCC4769569.1 phage tail protein [Methanosarcina sp. DH2]MDY9927099.1 phage tail protein [Methanosarcina sp.]